MLKGGAQLRLMIGPGMPSTVSSEVMSALIAVEVTNSTEEASGFQLSFTLGKTSAVNRKYQSGYFAPATRVIIVVIVKGNSQVLMDGVITKHSIKPSNSPGDATLTVTGEDLTRMMDIVDLSGIPYPAMPPFARVAAALIKYSHFGVIPKVLPTVLMDFPNPLEEIPSHSGTDLQYINALAEKVGYVFYLDPGPTPGMSIAYFGPEIKFGKPQHTLTVNSDAHNNADIGSLTFDGFKKTLFVILIQEKISKVPIPIPVPDITPLNPLLGRQPSIPLAVKPISGLAKYSPLQAAAIALAKASRASDVISGGGSLDVLRYGRVLKSRQLVTVRGATESMDGLYYVRSVTHNIKPGSYKQNFTLSRNAFFPGAGLFGPLDSALAPNPTSVPGVGNSPVPGELPNPI